MKLTIDEMDKLYTGLVECQQNIGITLHDYFNKSLGLDKTIKSMLEHIYYLIYDTSITVNIDKQIQNAASYIYSWKQRIADKPQSFIRACSLATKAFDYIIGNINSQ